MHQSRHRQSMFDKELEDLVIQVDLIRRDHPGCGVEKMYQTLKPKRMERDKFCEIFMELGYRVRRMKNYHRTTIPASYNYPNLIEGMEVTRPYQVLQSDITYFDIKGRFYYLVFIIDVYTREILGYNVGDNMRTECNIKALKMALSKIPEEQREGMVHHSDRGAQYSSNAYVKMLKNSGVMVSMGLKAQDNAYAERVNGIIKNEYLKRWRVHSFRSLSKRTKRAVEHYNQQRKHMAFNNKRSPKEFQKTWLSLANQERPRMIIYAEENYEIKMASNQRDLQPKEEPQNHNCPIVMMN
nr:IS3 family transposase [Gilvibacter sp.]